MPDNAQQQQLGDWMLKRRKYRELLVILAQTLVPVLLLTNCVAIVQTPIPTLTPTRTPSVTATPLPTATPAPIILNYSLVGRNLDGGYPEVFTFVIDDDEYTVDRTGKGLRVGTSSQFFSLPMEFCSIEGIIEQRIGYAFYHDDILFFYKGEIYGSTGYGYLTLLDKETLVVLWQTLIPAFNVGEPLFQDDHAYVTAIGFVGKIDLKSGTYIWQHDGLYDYRTYDFNSFEVPVLVDNRVLFQGDNSTGSPAKRVEVDDHTGEILGIYVTQD